jgi:heat shock protein HslJ
LEEKMKKITIVSAVLASLLGCASGPKFTDVSGLEWKLIGVSIEGQSINFDRNALVNDGFGEIFTLTFDAERLSGVGAPNRYFAPYTLGSKQAITVQTVAGTLMAAIRQPEKLRENDYFTYISNTYEWNLVGGNLELHSKNADGKDVVLTFTR